MSETSAHPGLKPPQLNASDEALRRVLQSHTFARAEKLQRFLRYVSEMTFRGDASLVHEHLIAVEVFGRGDDYSPGEDSVVRRQAHALRRKLKEYYETEGQSDPVQIELPVGTYVPVFKEHASGEAPKGPLETGHSSAAGSTKRFALIAGGIVSISLAFALGWAARTMQSVPITVHSTAPAPMRELWGTWLGHSGGPVLCFSNPATTSVRQFSRPIERNPEHQGLPVTPEQDRALRSFFSYSSNGNLYLYPVMAQAKMGEALAAIALTGFFTRAGLNVQATQSRFTTWDSLRKSNVILLGHADSNPWAKLVLKDAPFMLEPTDERRRARIINRSPKEGEQAEYLPTLPEQSKSYALLSMLPGVDGSHEILVVSGLDTSSTTGATDFLLSEASVGGLIKRLKALAPGHHGTWHFQAVLETDVRDTVALKAWVVALRVL